MANARVRRGRESEELVARYLRGNGFPLAERRPASLKGADVENTPGVAFEVKARRDIDLCGWMRQACERDGVPVVVVRPDGYGEANLPIWPAVIPLQILVQLLRDAGYGDSGGTDPLRS